MWCNKKQCWKLTVHVVSALNWFNNFVNYEEGNIFLYLDSWFYPFFPIIYHLIKKTKKPVNKEKNYLFSDHLTRHERCMYIEVWVTVKCWAFINNKEMYLRRLEWTLPECCSPLDWWNDLMIYKEAVKGSQQELAQQFERRRLLKGEERTCRRSRKHQ